VPRGGKDFETAHLVSSPLQVHPSLMFNCGIQDETRGIVDE
jgi:hypothetical protein